MPLAVSWRTGRNGGLQAAGGRLGARRRPGDPARARGAGGRGGTGVFELLASPPTTSRVLLAPTVLALAFTLVERRSWPLVGALAASALALSVIHPSYTPYVALLLGGFLFARLVVVRALDPLVKRAALALAAVTSVRALLPGSTRSRETRPHVRRGARASDQAHATRSTLRLVRFAPEAIARGGPVAWWAPRDPASGLRRPPALTQLVSAARSPARPLLGRSYSRCCRKSSRLAGASTVGFLPLAFALAGRCPAGRVRWSVALTSGPGWTRALGAVVHV